jgi:hypothetical protein
MTTYESLVARHESLHQQFADDPDSIEIDRARQMIAEVSTAGRDVSEISQRQQLRAILRYWGSFVRDRTGEYPNTHLLPYKPPGSPAATEQTASTEATPSALVPVAEQRTERTLGDRPAWFWPVMALVLLAAIALALVASAVWNRLSNPDTNQQNPIAVASPSTSSTSAELPGIQGDSDQDGLSDQQETLLGTDPATADTDGDGLLDGEEVLMHGTNPAAIDSDGDGSADGEEVALGSSPADPGSINPPAAYPAVPITATATLAASIPITVTATPAPPSGPVLVIIAPEGQAAVPLRIAPGESYAPVEGSPEVPVGTTVLIVRRTPDNSWYSIELIGGVIRGWLPAAYATVPETTNVAAVPTFVPPQQ